MILDWSQTELETRREQPILHLVIFIQICSGTKFFMQYCCSQKLVLGQIISYGCGGHTTEILRWLIQKSLSAVFCVLIGSSNVYIVNQDCPAIIESAKEQVVNGLQIPCTSPSEYDYGYMKAGFSVTKRQRLQKLGRIHKSVQWIPTCAKKI